MKYTDASPFQDDAGYPRIEGRAISLSTSTYRHRLPWADPRTVFILVDKDMVKVTYVKTVEAKIKTLLELKFDDGVVYAPVCFVAWQGKTETDLFAIDTDGIRLEALRALGLRPVQEKEMQDSAGRVWEFYSSAAASTEKDVNRLGY